MPTLYMMIGVPGSGKSTWIAQQNFDWNKTMVLSTDAYIDRRAAASGKTYSEVFQDAIKAATAEMNGNLKHALSKGMDIVWDQTNLTAKARKGKLDQIPETYRKVAVFFTTPDKDEHKRRLDARPGKTIPPNVLMGMASQLQRPTAAEGFDEIIVV